MPAIQGPGPAAAGVQGLLDRDGQGRVGAELDEEFVAVRGHALDGRAEEDWFAQVAPPVLAVQLLALDPRACHRRIQGHSRGVRVQARQVCCQGPGRALHDGRVAGPSRSDGSAEDIAAFEVALELGDGFGVPGHDGQGGSVGGGQVQAFPIADDLLGERLAREGDHGHRALSADGLQEFRQAVRAQAGHLSRVLEGEGTGLECGSYFAHAVTDDGVRKHTPRPPGGGDADL